MLLSPRMLLSAVGLALPLAAQGTTIITFDEVAQSFVHGEVVDTDYAGSGITIITTTNVGGGPNLGVIFDSQFGGATSDTDLLGPTWSGGNLAPNTVLDNMLIIQENSTGCGDDVCDDPDDEGTRPAGSFEFLFSSPVSVFGFDLVDVENTTDENGSVVFHDGLSTFTIQWSDFESGGSFEVAGLAFGDNTANRIDEITPGDVGLTKFDKIVINMGGSGAIDNLVIPEPATGVLLALGCLGLAVHRARRS